MVWAIVLLVGIAATGLIYAILGILFSEERQVKQQLERLSVYEAGQAEDAEPTFKSFRERLLVPAGRSLAQLSRLFGPSDYTRRLNTRLVQAGSPFGLDGERFLALKIVAAILAPGAFLLLALVGGGITGRVILAALVAGAAGFYLPDLWLHGRIAERKLAIRRTLPDMLDMLTISVEAGMGFDAAVARIVASRPGPLSEEFARMLQEVQAGIPRREALKHLTDRTQVPELNTFIMSMIQAEVFGVSVSNVLRTQSREMRVKRRQFAEEMAQKAPVKIVFPLVLCILPATIIVVAGPAIISVGRAFGMIGGG